MEIIKLDNEIFQKLKTLFHVSEENINDMIDFFSKTLKLEIKSKYLSHLVSTLEDIINRQEKSRIIADITRIKSVEADEKSKAAWQNIEETINSKHYKLFVITLVPIKKSKKNATSRIIKNNAVIYYNDLLEERQKRLLIAHELGHLVQHFIFRQTENENIATLFAYIAMLDKNRFYTHECKNYSYSSDLTILYELASVLHYEVGP
ncbi:ImmA/IrrE family metallo-endopeptidase [Treponema sp. OMZ 840]|uniref:ImmA/IrrE family metallo-endopeptidase n=1 Tax=Treponema sp. OMZ 840 TaxID=244313 RepID=UPI003D8B98DC